MSELYELPDGWEWKTLSDTVDNPKQDIVDGPFGSNLKASEYTDNGTPIIRLQNIDRFNFIEKDIKYITDDKAKQLKRHNFCKGDLVITKLGSPLGKCCTVPSDREYGIIVADIVRARINEERNIKKFIEYFINSTSAIKELQSHTKGATRPRVNLTHMRGLNIPLPPLQEQKRIVSKLDTLFEKIDKSIALHQKNMDEADVFMGSVLNNVFGELDTDKKISLKDIATKIGSGSTPRGGQKAYKTEGISLIRSMNVHDNGFRVKGLAFIDKEQAKRLDNVTIQKNDILLNITGASVARCCIVDEAYLPARVNQHVSIIRLKDEMIPSFLHYYLISPSVKSDLLFSSSGGATREAITKSMLEDFQVPVPPLLIQQKLVKYVNEISDKTEKVKSVQKEKMDSLKALKASILDRAFRGEL